MPANPYNVLSEKKLPRGFCCGETASLAELVPWTTVQKKKEEGQTRVLNTFLEEGRGQRATTRIKGKAA